MADRRQRQEDNVPSPMTPSPTLSSDVQEPTPFDGVQKALDDIIVYTLGMESCDELQAFVFHIHQAQIKLQAVEDAYVAGTAAQHAEQEQALKQADMLHVELPR